MASNTDMNLLSEAIDKADAEVLQSVLKSMCESSEDCRKEASKRLLLTTSAAEKQKRKSGDNSAGSPRANKKQKAKETTISRYEKCITCKSVFDVTKNNKKACVTHDDILEIDPEFFPDDDQVEMDPSSIDPETDWRRESCPEGFIWQCCDRTADEEGCCVQAHIAKGML